MSTTDTGGLTISAQHDTRAVMCVEARGKARRSKGGDPAQSADAAPETRAPTVFMSSSKRSPDIETPPGAAKSARTRRSRPHLDRSSTDMDEHVQGLVVAYFDA